MIEKDILYDVAQKCEKLVQIAESMHLTSIAKAIEDERCCQIFFEGFEKDLFTNCQCFTANVEPFKIFRPKDEQEFNFIQHFIFYKKDEDPGIERFRIAHEIGHCALHWPLGKRALRRIWGDIPDIGKCYIIDFNKEEEKQADAFACLLEVHRPKPLRSQTIEVNEKVHRIIKEYAKKGILQSINV